MVEVGRAHLDNDMVNRKNALSSSEQDVVIIVKASRFCISQSIYHNAKMVYPMMYDVSVGHVGKTSFSHIHTLTEKATKKVLLYNWKLLVAINTTSQKPTILPQYWTNLNATHATMDYPIKVERCPPPSDVHVVDLVATSSDCDHLNHVNHPFYIRFCLDAASVAHKAGLLRQFHGDISEYDVKQIDIIHDRQCYAGDKLAISVWEDADTESILHFLIECDHNLHTTCTITFYSHDSSVKV